jgi:DNA-binding transcriptional MerR regulator
LCEDNFHRFGLGPAGVKWGYRAPRTGETTGARLPLGLHEVGTKMSMNGQHAQAIPDRNLFRIGEVSRLTETKAFVLRYWETEFPTLQPVKSPKGHRLYRREDISTVLEIKRLLYDEGFTIAGARRHLNEGNGNGAEAPREPRAQGTNGEDRENAVALSRKTLVELRESLRGLLTLLERR